MRLFLHSGRTLAVLSLVASLAAQARPLLLHVTDLAGNHITQFAPDGTRAVVFVFAATDCPISRRYIPEISKIEKQYASQGVKVWWVFSNPGDTVDVVGRHELDFSIHSSTLVDPQQELAGMANASVTPEAAVYAVDRGGLRAVYRGRIDNRYVAFGKARPQATEHDLEGAIEAALTGKSAPRPSGGPVGCSIVRLPHTR